MKTVVRRTGSEGSALVTVVGALLVLSAMLLGLVLLSMTESLASGNARRAASALYAAQAGTERALTDLAHLPDWSAALDGRAVSGLVDGTAGGERVLSDGRRISLDALVNLANCGVETACTAAQMDAVTAERPWGRNNPRWRLFAHGRLAALALPDAPRPDEYIVVLVADDAGETDDDPLRDGRPGNPGAGVVMLRAEAFGADAARRAIEVTVARGVPAPAASGYAGQQGEGRTADDSAASIQVPGGSLTRLEMPASGGMSRQ